MIFYHATSPVSRSWVLTATFLLVYSNAFSCTSSRQKHGRLHRYHAPSSGLSASLPPITNSHTAHADTKPVDSASSGKCFQFFLRCSPLIGGPSFLPLHVEVILVQADEYSTSVEYSIDAVLNRAPNEYFDIHRFDFLPEKPREQSTIVRLMQLQPVSGLVRYRCCPAIQTGDNIPGTQLDKCGNAGDQQEERGVTMLLRLGTSSSRNVSTSTSILTTAMDFMNSYKATYGRELRILGGKNCLSFALDMISHIDDAHGIDVKFSLPKIF
eukprot:CCRYP_005268-RA/>CCRYP_005268-RA protein AED:0.43 eAED:0.43 QI:0/-1/0/1/-1/1/1/0/268